jgi:hypothetical protein
MNRSSFTLVLLIDREYNNNKKEIKFIEWSCHFWEGSKMKGFFLVIMMIGLLIVSLLVVRNLSTRQTLEGDISQIETMDQAKELTDFVNQRAKEMERKLQHAQ